MLLAKAIKAPEECLNARDMQKATLLRMALSVVAGEGFGPSKGWGFIAWNLLSYSFLEAAC